LSWADNAPTQESKEKNFGGLRELPIQRLEKGQSKELRVGRECTNTRSKATELWRA
jgi:hypothetical protein